MARQRNHKTKKQEAREYIVAGLGRAGITILCVMVLLLLSAFPFYLVGIGDLRPAFLLMAVYYWAITAPDTLRPLAAFAAGLLLDLIAGYPLGVTALVLVAAQWALRAQRKFMMNQPFRVLWACFALVAFLASLFQWLVFSGFDGAFLPLKPIFASMLLSVLLFPLFAPLFARVNKILADDAGSL